MELTEGTLLGGRVIFRQPLTGYRTGIEPVLLAACVPARVGERVLEGGTGAGAALLCLSVRLPGVSVVGVECDEGLATLAEANITANGLPLATVMRGDVRHLPALEPFDHAMANPPWHDARSTGSPDAMRDRAKRAGATLLDDWCVGLARLVRAGGSLTLILPASSTQTGMAALADAGCGDLTLLPFWSRAGYEARLVLLRGIKSRRGGNRILPGLVLHDGDGYTGSIRHVLWDGAPLLWD